MSEKLIFISAGDPSGDNAIARSVEILKQNNNIKLAGLGGPKLKACGQQQLAHPDDLAVIGFWEVAKKYFYFRRLFKSCVEYIKTSKPDLIVLVDYPGFNLRLAKAIKKYNIPIIYYISPQVWAWGRKRVEQIQKLVDLMIPILPFELDFYKEHEVNCRYVGHYLLEDIEPEYIASTPPENSYLGLLPGSRHQEIERMLPVMIESARMIYKKYQIKAVIAGISERFDYQKYLTSETESFLSIVYDNSREVVYNSSLVLTASGTATLEIGIIGRPMVIIYKTGGLTYRIAKNLVKLDKIGLINLVLNSHAVPELIQHDANKNKITAALSKFIEDKQYRAEVVDRLHKTKELLGDRQASQKVAELIGEYL